MTFRKARPDEIGIMGINSQDKQEGEGKTLLSTKEGRLVFYGAMTYSMGALSVVTGKFIHEYLTRVLGKGRKL